MKVFTATKQTQGHRKSDFCFADEGELLAMPFICDRDLKDPDPDGGCGCGRALTGFLTRKGTTTFLVKDIDITEQKFIDLYKKSEKDSGWPIDDGTAHEARGLLKLANSFEVGDICEKRKHSIQKRSLVNGNN